MRFLNDWQSNSMICVITWDGEDSGGERQLWSLGLELLEEPTEALRPARHAAPRSKATRRRHALDGGIATAPSPSEPTNTPGVRLIWNRRSARGLAVCLKAPTASLFDKKRDIALIGANIERDASATRVPIESEGE